MVDMRPTPNQPGVYVIPGGFVIYGDKEITITFMSGAEIVHWIEDEWVEDPQVVFSIVEAVRLAGTEGAHAVERKVRKENFHAR
jgi:hypothetical protein